MKVIEQIEERIRNLLTAPGDELGRWARFLRFQIRLWKFCGRRLRKNNAMAMSAALSFRTIFAVIPALVLVVIMLKPFGLVEDAKLGITDLLSTVAFDQIALEDEIRRPPGEPIDPWFEEPVMINVADNIERLVNRVERQITFGRLGPVGVVLLIWTALTLLTTMERSLNRIFGARRIRPIGRRVLLYWSVVTLCPVLVAAAVYLGRPVAAGLRGMPVVSWLLATVEWLAPVVIWVMVLALVYKLMPNTTVGFREAVVGAVVAAPLWLVAKWGFGLYVTHFVGGKSLYGTLGLLPLFLLWLNLSWLLFLFGAELAHAAANIPQMEAGEGAERFVPTPSAVLGAAAAVAGPFLAGEGPVPGPLVAEKLRLPVESAEVLLDKLVGMGVVGRVESADGQAYVLARPPDKIPVTELLEIDACRASSPDGRAYDPDVARAVDTFRGHACGLLAKLTLADMIKNDAVSKGAPLVPSPPAHPGERAG